MRILFKKDLITRLLKKEAKEKLLMRRAILHDKISRKVKEVKAKDAEKSFAVFALFFPALREKTLN